MKNQTFKSKRGSVMLATVGLAIVGATIIAGYLTMSHNEYKLAQRTLMLQSAMNLAEAGLEEGMDAINTSDWTGWSAVGSNGYFSDVTSISFSDTRNTQLRVYVEDYDTLPILAAEGRITSANGDVVFKQIRVDLARSSVFANGLTAKRTISFSGNNVSVDAYDSTLGPHDPTLNHLDQGTVASLSVDNGDLDVGNGDIWGYVATGGGTPDVGPSGSIMGVGSTDRIDEDRISDSFYANLWDVSTPSGTVDGVNYTTDFTTLAAGTIGATGTTSNPEVYVISSFSISGTDQLDVVGPAVIIVSDAFSVAGGAGINILSPDGTLEMYAAGDVKIAGNGLLNNPLAPEAFQLWGTAPTGSTQSIHVTGNGDTAGVIYAPNAELTLNGNGGISGAAVGKNIDLTGNAEFHYDVNLKGFEKHSTYSIDRWRELRGISERLDFSDRASVAAAISPL